MRIIYCINKLPEYDRHCTFVEYNLTYFISFKALKKYIKPHLFSTFPRQV